MQIHKALKNNYHEKGKGALMNIICNKSKLTEAVSTVSRAVSGKSMIPALEGILLKAADGQLILSGYDLEMGITTAIEAMVKEPGELVLSARLFSDMVRRMPSDEVTILSDEKLLTQVIGGATEYTILGLNAQEYPELPSLSDSVCVSISQSMLKSMIMQTLFAISVSDAKPILTGALFEISENDITVVSVDGYRMALRRENVKAGQPINFVVPGKALHEIAKLLDDSEEAVTLQVSKKHIIVNIGGYSVISRLLEGDFLDYRSAIPNDDKMEVTVGVREFIQSIERTSLLISDRLKSPLRIKLESGLVKILCSTTMGKAYDEFAVDGITESMEIGFNSKYLLDALRASECDRVKLLISGPRSPVKVVPMDSDNFLFLVLPVRLKSE